MSDKTGVRAVRTPLLPSVIEDLRKRGFNQSEIADMHGVTPQAVSWQKLTYGGFLTTRQIVHKAWPWVTTNLHGKSTAYQRLRDHGEFMRAGGFGTMSADKQRRLKAWWRLLRDQDVVVEFDPEIPPIPGVSPHGGFRYAARSPEDGDLLIRVNDHTELTRDGKKLWRWPPDIEKLLQET